MARKKQTRGTCVFCDREMTRSGISKHLQSCSKRKDAIAKAEGSKRKEQTLYHQQIQDAWRGDFWLHLEINGNSTLESWIITCAPSG